jgi:hypothetical protein
MKPLVRLIRILRERMWPKSSLKPMEISYSMLRILKPFGRHIQFLKEGTLILYKGMRLRIRMYSDV